MQVAKMYPKFRHVHATSYMGAPSPLPGDEEIFPGVMQDKVFFLGRIRDRKWEWGNMG